MEVQQETRIMEERKELMVSPTGNGKPTLRMAHFLNPSLSSMANPLHTPSPLSLSSTTSETQTQKNPLNVSFKGWRDPQKNWKNWVDHMCSLHKSVREKAGIYEAIMGSVYTIRKDCELVIKVAQKWCPETKSFVFDFGEATITLEDMITLGGYSVMDDSVLSPLPSGRASEEIREELLRARLELVRTSARRANQGAWMNKFMNNGNKIEHEAFLSLWLSRFVFPSAAPYDSIGERVLPIAILLAKGTKIALAPAVLASIYRNLSMLREENQNDASALTIWAPFQLIQVWIWERFPALGPNPNSWKYGEPRLARWHMVKKPNLEDIEFSVATNEKCFLWRPCILAGTNQLIHYKLYGETEKWVLVSPRLVEVVETFARCVRVAELVGFNCIEQYFPHRVSRQFGMDQDIPGKVVFHSNGNHEIAWENYSRPILDAKLHIPSRWFKSHVTTRYLEWWTKSDETRGIVIKENDYDANFPPGFPPKGVGKMANMFPSIPPGFPSQPTIKTEDEAPSDFPSIPPNFPPRIASNSVNNESPATPSSSIGMKKRDSVASIDTLPLIDSSKKMKGK